MVVHFVLKHTFNLTSSMVLAPSIKFGMTTAIFVLCTTWAFALEVDDDMIHIAEHIYMEKGPLTSKMIKYKRNSRATDDDALVSWHPV